MRRPRWWLEVQAISSLVAGAMVNLKRTDGAAAHRLVMRIAVLTGVLAIAILSACGRLLIEPVEEGVVEVCPAPCVADAAAAFDGSSDGADNRWRYVGDRRDRTWQPMVGVADAMVGEVQNRIERCTDQSQADACTALRGALLVTSSGISSASDPAIVYVAPDDRVIQLSLRVHVPRDGVEHRIRLYRNSREDVLFTAFSSPGMTVSHAITVDALTGDRFVASLESQDIRGSASALHLFVTDAGIAFPSSCELALGFSASDIAGTAVDDLCGAAFRSLLESTPVAPSLTAGPFAEHAMGVYLESALHLLGSRPLLRGASTIQFWIRLEATTYTKSAVFSDIDENSGQGLLVQFDGTSGSIRLEVAAVTNTSPVTYTSQRIDFASHTRWRFVRIVRSDAAVAFCLDGARVTSFPFAAPSGPGTTPTIGRNGPWNPPNELIGTVDDLRVFSTVLPCDE